MRPPPTIPAGEFSSAHISRVIRDGRSFPSLIASNALVMTSASPDPPPMVSAVDRSANIAIVLPGRKGEVFWGKFRLSDGGVEQVRKTELVSVQELASHLPEKLVIAGEGAGELDNARRNYFALYSIEASAAIVAELGEERARSGEYADIASLEPFYGKEFLVKDVSARLPKVLRDASSQLQSKD